MSTHTLLQAADIMIIIFLIYLQIFNLLTNVSLFIHARTRTFPMMSSFHLTSLSQQWTKKMQIPALEENNITHIKSFIII